MEKLKIKKVNMLKCDVCNAYHPEDDCEIVTIKIIKGKDCALTSPAYIEQPIKNNTVRDTNSTSTAIFNVELEQQTKEIKQPDTIVEKLKDPNVIKMVSAEEKKDYLKKTASAIPPAMLRHYGNMFNPGEGGAKNTV